MVIKQLIYLLALAKERHFGAAAERCHITQPTFSAAIRQLEEDLRVPIVERGNRFIGFTPEGERVLEYARRIVADCDSLRLELSELRQGLSGHLKLGAVPSALPVVAWLTAPFAKAHPNVTIEIFSMTSTEIQTGLDGFELDAGLTYLDNEPLMRVRTAALYEEEYILLTPVSGSLAGQERVTWAEAAAVPLALLTGNMQNRRIVNGIFASLGREPQPGIETNSIVALCLHVSAGPWSAVMPQTLLGVMGVPAGTVAKPLIAPEIRHVMGIVIPDRSPPPPLARELFTLAPTLGLQGKFRPA
jgi:DNA-binding transcriptional LysR family regulator